MFAEASSGCPIPDLRFSRPKKFGTTTTEQPYVTFETTQVYVSEDFTTADFEYEHGFEGENEDDDEDDDDDDESGERRGGGDVARQTRYTDFNPYAWGEFDGGATAATKRPSGEEPAVTSQQQPSRVERRKMRKHSSGRRRLERPYQQHGHKQAKRDLSSHLSHPSLSYNAPLSSSFLMHHETHNDDVDDHDDKDDHMHHQHITNIYYMQSTGMTSTMKFAAGDELAVQLVPKSKKKKEKKHQNHPSKRHRLQPPQGTEDTSNDDDEAAAPNQAPGVVRRHRRHAHGDRDGVEDQTTVNSANLADSDQQQYFANELVSAASLSATGTDDGSGGSADELTLRRVKRKSGKTTGALSRPKGASDSGSKSTSRKKDGECPFEYWFEFNVCSCFPSFYPNT